MVIKEYPADELKGLTINGWYVESRHEQKTSTGGRFSSCYKVTNNGKIGFLKAFDYRDLIKAEENGDNDNAEINHDRVWRKFKTERDIIKKCNEEGIDSVVAFIESGVYNKAKGSLNTRVNYFILEYSNDGNVQDQMDNDDIDDLKHKFKSIAKICDGLFELHNRNITHLDLKPSNLIYFVADQLTKITDFGSARQWLGPVPEDLKDDENRIMITKRYAPPEILYKEEEGDWKEYRRKIDLYLLGNIIVVYFTKLTFTSLLDSANISFDSWRNEENNGKMKQLIPNLTSAATKVYVLIEERINNINDINGNPLSESDIRLIINSIKELCNPNPQERGNLDALNQTNPYDGLDRIRDRFINLSKKAEIRNNTQFNFEK